jgi:phage terminase large subunit-like protein
MLVDAGIKPEIVTPNEGKFMVSVDPMAAPTMEHSGIATATKEAERQAKLNPNRTVRILQLVGWRRAAVTTTMTGEP